jgi:hypothetical protein
MRHKLLRRPEAAKVLLGILPVIRSTLADPTAPVDDDWEPNANHCLKTAIEWKDLRPILDGPEEAKRMIAARIVAFMHSQSAHPADVIARLPVPVSERDVLAGALRALLPGKGYQPRWLRPRRR